MKQTNSLRQKSKYLISLFIPISFLDRLRNFLSLRQIIFFDRNLRNKVLKLKNESQGSIRNNLDLLKKLNSEFKTINLKNNYNFDNLILSSKQRFNYLKSKGINFKGKKLRILELDMVKIFFCVKNLNLKKLLL